MNKNNYGVPSLILGGLSFFFSFMNGLESRGPEIFFVFMSIGAIVFGFLALIKRQMGISAGTGFLGLMLGLLCLFFALPYWIPVDKYFKFNSGYKDIRFLGNTNIVGLRYCESYDDCFIKYIFDVSTQRFSKQKENCNLDKYSYSRDGSKMLFIDGSEEEKNIFMMNSDGTEKRQLTSHTGPIKVIDDYDLKTMKVKTNSCPSFAPDGKRVIFVRCNFLVKKKGESALSQCDIHETNLDTGEERKLTNHNFNYISCPHYFSDGERFIFSDGTGIYIMDENNIERKAAIKHPYYSTKPSISFDDKITYIGCTSNCYDNDIFVKVGDEIKQLTDMKSEIISAEISSDGTLIVFKEGRKNYAKRRYWIMNSDGTNLKELLPPKD